MATAPASLRGPGSFPAADAAELPGPGAAAGEMGDAEFLATARQIFRDAAARLSQAASRQDARPLAEDLVAAWAEDQARGTGPLASPGTQAALAQAVLDEQFGLGALQPYVDDPRVENIDVNGPQQVLITLRDGRRLAGRPVAGSDSDLMEMVRTWGLREGQTPREFSVTNPLLNAALNQAGVRLSAVMSVTPEVHVSVRCHRLVDITLEDLCGPGYGTLTPGLAHFLTCAVRAYRNIIVTGGVDAGKTTLLRALAAAIEPGERVATLESEYELYLHQMPARHRDVVPMEARQANAEGAGGISLYALIPQALRLNPRRVIVGEVRDREVVPMLEAFNTGHRGSLCTMHADGADEVFNRILMLARRGDLALPPEVIHLYVGMARPFVVHITKDPATHQRYVTEVIEVLPPGDGAQPARNHVWVPGPDGRAAPGHSLSPQALQDLLGAGFNPDVLAGALP
ncbi:MAG TPA: CpaF/VirB11 family protein [Streptosporangiaceae bacterium]|jgi:Flp pilus assembly CpaF family ATPase